MDSYNRIAPDVTLGEGVRLACFINAYGCRIGERTKIGAFVEIQKNAVIGADCKISSHSFICEGVSIGDGVFYGCTSLRSMTIPASVTSIGDNAFSGCKSLNSIYFVGNAPRRVGASAFSWTPARVYYLHGTTGWRATCGRRRTAVWQR